MAVQHIVVIGNEWNKSEECPLVRTLWEIGAALGKKNLQVVVCSPEGVIGDKGKITGESAAASARRILIDVGEVRLLLFDAISIAGELRPSPALAVWLSSYRAFVDLESEPEVISLADIVSYFLDGKDPGLFWAGIVKPAAFDVVSLVKPQWREFMNSLAHGENDE